MGIPIAPSLHELEKILYTLEQSEEPKIKGIIYLFIYYCYIYKLIYIYFYIDWIHYYRQPYVLASLNLYASEVDPEIWARSSNNTNVAEAAHALANREGKHLKLLTAIIRYLNNTFI